MGVVSVFLLVVMLPLAAVGFAFAFLGLLRRPVPAPSEAAAAARRHAAGVSLLAWAAALVLPPVALFAAVRTGPGSGLVTGALAGLEPACVGIIFLAVHALGERTWPRPTGTIRRAALTPRYAADVAPRWLRRTVWSWGGLLGTALVAFGIAASDGRALTRSWEGGAASASPFPGWYYGVPLLVAAALVLAGSEGVLRLIARRPAVMDAQPEWDLGLRRLSAHRLLRGVQLVLGLTAAGVLVVAGSALAAVGRSSDGSAADGFSPGMVSFGAALTIVALAVCLASLVIALVPGRPAMAPVLP